MLNAKHFVRVTEFVQSVEGGRAGVGSLCGWWDDDGIGYYSGSGYVGS